MARWQVELAAVLALGCLAGGWAGSAVSADAIRRTPPYGTVAGADAAGGTPGPASSDASIVSRPGLRTVDYEAITRACAGCSDFQLGWRLAEREGVSQTADCEDYSWSFEPGCLAYLRQSRS